ncbi:MAG TPA: carboxypeptidase-like regulatory domain-containing protein [Candidatus Acidoferrum sp.]|nr:carboxypeptidase-like regulatory domain-containing protein [Candidatus Acidoferrum sp.]
MKKTLLAVAFLISVPAFAQDKINPPVPPAGNVTLPLEEYNRLLELANKSPRRVEAAPLPYTIKRGDLKLRVANETVLGTVQLQGETFNKGETKVALTSGMTILDARQEGRSLPLEQETGTQTAILAGPAEFSVVLDAGLPLNIETGRASFVLPVPSAGSARLILEVPGDHTNVKLSPGLITSRESANGNTTIEATLVPGQPANIWWATREVVAPVVPREVRFLSNVKTLVSVSEADIRLAVLADINVIQGEPTQFEVEVPAGYEVTGASGASVDSSDVQSGVLTLKVNAPAQRTHQFLISMEKAIGATKADVPFLSVKNSQRETGEVLVEGVGTMELTATEGGSLKRMDVRETNPYLRSLARSPLQAAFRYHRQPAENPILTLEWTRFPDSSVLAAVAERAVVTTLVTTEGRSLTEVKLTVKNQVQPFLKVELPAGASIVSADVAGEKVKPVEGADGQRVPLLRPGFRPVDSYEVSFVFMHSGAPFAKKGGSEISLPKMDVPITVLQWEVFLPEQYKVKDFGGDALAANLLPPSSQGVESSGAMSAWFQAGAGVGGNVGDGVAPLQLLPGQIGGYIVDASGAMVANAQVNVTQLDTGAVRTAATDYSGRWIVSSMPSGRVKITATSPGFNTTVSNINYDANYPTTYNFQMRVASVAETVEVQSNAQMLETLPLDRDSKKKAAAAPNTASNNVLNLQRRVSGVLPVRVDVPRAGSSYSFVRPLVLDEETKLTFTYKTK